MQRDKGVGMLQKIKALSKAKKTGLAIAALAVIGLANGSPQPKQANLQVEHSSSAVLGASTNSPAASDKAPVITTKTLTETKAIPFASTTTNDGSLPKGQTKVITAGVNGVSTLTYKVTLANGKETDRKLISQTVTTPPITQVTAIGTYVASAPVAAAPRKVSSRCDPNYAGACVPIASDVDCAGGGGNGPAFVQGPIRVIGTDIYGLDRDGNGIGCE